MGYVKYEGVGPTLHSRNLSIWAYMREETLEGVLAGCGLTSQSISIKNMAI